MEIRFDEQQVKKMLQDYIEEIEKRKQEYYKKLPKCTCCPLHGSTKIYDEKIVL